MAMFKQLRFSLGNVVVIVIWSRGHIMALILNIGLCQLFISAVIAARVLCKATIYYISPSDTQCFYIQELWANAAICILPEPVSDSKDFLKYFDRIISYTDSVLSGYLHWICICCDVYLCRSIHLWFKPRWDSHGTERVRLALLIFLSHLLFSVWFAFMHFSCRPFPIPFKYFKDLLISPVWLKMPS